MGYFEIGILHPRNSANVGTLWRSAYQLGASGIFIIGALTGARPAIPLMPRP